MSRHLPAVITFDAVLSDTGGRFPFTLRDASRGVLWLRLWNAQRCHRPWYFRSATINSATVTTTRHAAMAVDAQQSVTRDVSTDVSATSATFSTCLDGHVANASLDNPNKVCVDTTENANRPGSGTDVPICGGPSQQQADGYWRYVTTETSSRTVLTALQRFLALNEGETNARADIRVCIG